jgi:hypothetical protein
MLFIIILMKESAVSSSTRQHAQRTARGGRSGLGKPVEVADYLGVPEHTLAQWRYRGIGPRYSHVGRHVRYRWGDVEQWLDEQASRPAGDAP